MAYNATVHSSTNDTPFFLMHGFDPNLPDDPAKIVEPEDNSPETYKNTVVNRLKEAWKISLELNKKAQAAQARFYDENATEYEYLVEGLVMVKIPAIKKNKCRKLSKFWYGPYRIKEIRMPNLVVQLTNKKDAKVHTVHNNQVKPCYGPRTTPLYRDDPLDLVVDADPNLQAEEDDDE
jgi:hypothetical protein